MKYRNWPGLFKSLPNLKIPKQDWNTGQKRETNYNRWYIYLNQNDTYVRSKMTILQKTAVPKLDSSWNHKCQGKWNNRSRNHLFSLLLFFGPSTGMVKGDRHMSSVILSKTTVRPMRNLGLILPTIQLASYPFSRHLFPWLCPLELRKLYITRYIRDFFERHNHILSLKATFNSSFLWNTAGITLPLFKIYIIDH